MWCGRYLYTADVKEVIKIWTFKQTIFLTIGLKDNEVPQAILWSFFPDDELKDTFVRKFITIRILIQLLTLIVMFLKNLQW